MYNLFLSPARQSLAHIHVIQLLAIHVIEITIPLQLINPRNFINIFELRDALKSLEGGDKGKFVEIATGNDPRVAVFCQNGGDEGLGAMPCEILLVVKGDGLNLLL